MTSSYLAVQLQAFCFRCIPEFALVCVCCQRNSLFPYSFVHRCIVIRFCFLFICSLSVCLKEKMLIEIKAKTRKNACLVSDVVDRSDMLKSHVRGAASKKSTASMSLLDSLRLQVPSSSSNNNQDTDWDADEPELVASGWTCDVKDWSKANATKEAFPSSLRSLERKEQQKKNQYLPVIRADENNSPSSSPTIDVSKLTSTVTELITGKGDQMAYADFLSILQHYSVHATRDDHLEETIYHLIQAGVSYVRSNEHRFDTSKLHECYRQRHRLRTGTVH